MPEQREHLDRKFARRVRALFAGEITMAALQAAADEMSRERWSLDKALNKDDSKSVKSE